MELDAFELVIASLLAESPEGMWYEHHMIGALLEAPSEQAGSVISGLLDMIVLCLIEMHGDTDSAINHVRSLKTEYVKILPVMQLLADLTDERPTDD